MRSLSINKYIIVKGSSECEGVNQSRGPGVGRFRPRVKEKMAFTGKL